MNALYRGKCTDTGELVYGLPHTVGSQTLIVSADIEDWGEDYIAPDWWIVDPATIGQYTGLDDKNGAKIFKSDKCKVCWRGKIFVGVVVYAEQIAAFKIDLAGIDKCILFLDLFQSQDRGEDTWVEVIGNIHDKKY